ncbi:Cerebroside-sulfatase [Mangrovimicrobium sediminis]|uniref:Cerebroside-sulfatase n=2 Tax=Mangrovimicrobium sediminis TaxID=2562682 RepID=A0A4Z0M2C9_9GAMM|nr:Cerebroside-sulfatase [Haliea sp. SAOS-164]
MLGTTAAQAAKAADSADRLPNIILILSDDIGYADLHSYGHPYAKTPSLDALAAQGTRFTQHYVTGVTCGPSRAGLMGGLFPARISQSVARLGFSGQTTITDLLAERGYTNGHFGKWNLGPSATQVDGTYGIHRVKEIPGIKAGEHGRDDDLFDAAIDFIRENAERPFYVNIWGRSTHRQVRAPQRLIDEFSDLKVDREQFAAPMQKNFDRCLRFGCDLDATMRTYLADVYSLDLNVGRLLAVLDELGLAEHSIVVYSSDNGPAPVEGNKYGEWPTSNTLGYAGVLRGGKHDYYEGGVRVPFIIRWPGHVPAGRVSDDVTSFIDWMPTLAAITGMEALPQPLDGEDVSDIWRGESRERSKPLFWRVNRNASLAAMREGRWKLHYHTRRNRPPRLYDLEADPGETENLAEQHPEVVEAMGVRLQAWVDSLPDNYVRPPRESEQ